MAGEIEYDLQSGRERDGVPIEESVLADLDQGGERAVSHEWREGEGAEPGMSNMRARNSSVPLLATRNYAMLIDCHAHIIPEQALRRFPEPEQPRYVTAEPGALQRMLDEHDRVGMTHAVVSDSFFMESARDALPDWSTVDRARLFNDGMVELVGRYPGRLFGLGCIDPFGGEASRPRAGAADPRARAVRRADQPV